jgi:hypothetical protein
MPVTVHLPYQKFLKKRKSKNPAKKIQEPSFRPDIKFILIHSVIPEFYFSNVQAELPLALLDHPLFNS